ncbi:sugar O-acyltransferase, sialic acid O-acetyltransferase NeuD family protein [Nitritalea halalkaliphila LW7]|uniref:Sugar O-acyltransferase, sialic acid O-acetyltransferase NeuD family protein n=1 Tax=Nitritalea halalkaliphila LW7 TaxID=1189621 RepID=I5C5Y3_9BACT|nr:NeuD/PglB/VioB family sugar acetyltransferase [Nitritalea halalkaliphila]EIM77235.1 sugar O-acyltransferase, sialic acid O-acetyltransferase NeuD family protein [Nitritalea halalkaliphila LW7]
MSDSKKVFIFGYSGHAYVIIESFMAAGYTIAGYFDYHEAKTNPYQIPYFGFEGSVDVSSIVKSDYVFPSVGDNIIRAKLVSFFEKHHLNQCVLIDPSSKVSHSSSIGLSTYVGVNTIINAHAQIGKGVIINTAAVVEHECVVQDFSHIAPAAVLCGNVSVGKSTFIGANSVVRNNISIYEKSTVGAGSVIVKDIITAGIYFGNPCKQQF